MERRRFLTTGLLTGTALMGGLATGRTVLAAASSEFEVTRSDAEWREMLTELEYYVMREQGTERAGTSPLDKIYADGTYHCRGCDLPVYAAEHKFDSGTGWPSFTQAMPGAIETMDDRQFIWVYTECHCRRCGSHFGHIFDDGPAPTGKRHCLNGVSLVFKEA